MQELEFKINKEIWIIKLYPENEYIENVGDDSEAEVDVNQKVIAFCQNRITRDVLEHEITHIYFDKCCLRSIDSFTKDQMEEFVAEFVPRYSREIIKIAKNLEKKIEELLIEN